MGQAVLKWIQFLCNYFRGKPAGNRMEGHSLLLHHTTVSSWRTHTKVKFSKTNVILLWIMSCHLQQSRQFYSFNSEVHASQQQHTGSSVKPVNRGHRGNNTPLTAAQTLLYQCTWLRCPARRLVIDLQESRAHEFIIIVSLHSGSNWHSLEKADFFPTRYQWHTNS